MDGKLESNRPSSSIDGGAAVRIYRPQPRLQSYITFFYVVEASAGLTDFLYPEWGNIRFAVAGEWHVDIPGFENSASQTAALFGPTDRHGKIVTSGGKTIGFGLTPLGWHRLISGNASQMANRVEPLGNRLGIEGETLRAQLMLDETDEVSLVRLEQVILHLLDRKPPISCTVLAADRALRMRPTEVGEFARAANVSARTLNRLCLNTFGFAPKRLMRLQRFLDTLGRVRTAVGEALGDAIDSAYYDQSHFYRDFRDFMAMTPRAYFRAPRQLMAAAADAQIRAGVTLSFRLPPQTIA
ncbi:AraC family transcriptional regulator [Sphingomonas antarctica]|uniref:AraC family transcriptional regulator n=1 Tax=Sphingomonas antarctica TaxID=2040274 RepID=UPI0039E97F9F